MICTKNKILFLHIPKTGGTTIEKNIFPGYHPGTEPDYSILCGWDDRFGWLSHLTMNQIIELCPRLDLSEYLAFTVVRNPWDRLVSEYHWKISISGLRIPFFEYVRLLYLGETEVIQKYYKSPLAFEQHMRPQVSFLLQSINCVFRILRFENFKHEVRQIFRMCGANTESLPRIRASNHTHYTHYYNSCSIDMVRDLYQDDIEQFGYSYC